MWHNIVRFGLLRIFYPCLMIFGTIGNILCLKILLRKRFRRQSTCQYLCILAVIDILFIYLRSTRYVYRYMFHVDVRNTSLWICRSFTFFSSSLSHLASWILVIVSFDRYFIMKNFFTRRNASSRVRKSSCILILIVCTENLHYFHVVGTHIPLQISSVQTDLENATDNFNYTLRFVCMARQEYEEFFRLYVPIFDLLFVAIIPFCLMVFTNIGIIRTTMHSNMLFTTSKKQQRNNRLTIMLLSVTLAFMLLTCPSVVYICINRLKSPKRVSDTKLLVLDLLESLWYTKHALNFILYTLSGQDFRREFIKLLSCSQRKVPNRSNNLDNNSLNIQLSVYTDNSPYVNRRVLHQRHRQSDCELNKVPTLLISKSLCVRAPTGIHSDFIVSTTYSTTQTGTSNARRSSSTTKTSVQ
ncbi:unnamed protein product [Adineta ricciae]|uniref:G-protein coupled receptors family 1 profile domain-containing protein n=1 Tax=Adineta ricciae TaxID=249248 RepID=A0A813PAW2_ADIRI|nr:unnamed protein product [Adineta ricciae]CAF1184996.1 unnamed protein product [Adineta ricciae]